MKAIKHHDTTYNTLGGCLEAYYGEKRAARPPVHKDYREPKQGFHTVLFKSLPLQLDYMRRRKTSAR